jgi:flagellar basal-body rod protein FlgF
LDTSLYVNLSYQSSLDRRLELVANNIANLNTTGFKAERAMFDDASFKAGPAADVSFVIDRASYTDFKTGSVTQTGNQLDIAVVGDGWISVETDEGIRYTRDGRMTINAQGELSALDGGAILDRQGGRIQIPQEANNVAISRAGQVSVQIQGEPLPIELGEIGIFEFADPQNLIREADGRFNADGLNAQVAEDSRVQQFAIESSNINPIKEIIELMELSRAYSQTAGSSQDIHDQKKDSIKRLGSNK